MPIRDIFKWKKQKKSQNGGNVQRAEQLFSTTGGYGLKELAEGIQAIVDIVFVHGVTGNRETTWTYNRTLFWPRDLLAQELPNARVLTFGYDADIVDVLNTAGSNSIYDHGKSLVQDLSMRRIRTQSNDRPIVFVAHSLGGLVVEQALLIARGTSQPHMKSLLSSTSAIAFMGTPHLGSSKAEWALPITRLSSLLRRTNKDIVAVLKPGSEMLANLQQEFHTMLEDRKRNEGKWIDIFCFYEEIAYPGIGEIVPRQSAILPEYPNANIHRNHSDMTKFSSETDAGYIRVRDQLWLWIDAVSKKPEDIMHTGQLQMQAQDAPQGISEPLSADQNQYLNRHEERSQANRQSEGRTISSGGGPIFMGNIRAGRDFTHNQRT